MIWKNSTAISIKHRIFATFNIKENQSERLYAIKEKWPNNIWEILNASWEQRKITHRYEKYWHFENKGKLPTDMRNTERLLRIKTQYPAYEIYSWAPFENKEKLSNMPFCTDLLVKLKSEKLVKSILWWFSWGWYFFFSYFVF